MYIERSIMPIHIHSLAPADYPYHRPVLIDLLIDAVDGGASVNFLAPMDRGLAERFWDKVATQVEAGERIIMLALDGDHLVGSAQVALAMQPNGVHRAEIQKVLVHSTQRRRGIGTLLMSALEAVARQHHRTLLTLDTETISAAVDLYTKAGYTRVGDIPAFALDTTGIPQSATIFYKQL